MQTFLLATQNPDKVEEIKAILSDVPFNIKSLIDISGLPEVVEDGNTLEENALKKGRIIFEATGLPCLADDTGLEVFCLDMRPGVYSARYAGDHVSYDDNNRKLLAELQEVTDISNRGARFRCVAAFVGKDIEKITVGICHGAIGFEPHGTGGFGYDPLFIPKGYIQTFAELSPEVKNRISHRAKAFQLMRKLLISHFK